MDREKLKEILFTELGDKKSHPWREKAGKYSHGVRVASLVIRLREKIVPDDTSMDDILYAAALFHDVRGGVADHERLGAIRTRELISELVSSDELDKIASLIEVHDQRTSPRENFTTWQKLLQDADLLDHHGSFEIWETFMYAPFSNQTITEILTELCDVSVVPPGRAEGAMNFDESREICRERDSFMHAFARRFLYEAEGKIWEDRENFL